DGTLTPRSTPGAMISDPLQAIQQLITMLEKGHVIALSGKQVPIQADTLCLHGDQPGAAAFAQQIHQALKRQGLL
ncbi:MAG: LamB/YcsF family protein, partial [Advenella sp.]|nr:LamB/YcsF family protein [Advenella sp.]